jgi:transposase
MHIECYKNNGIPYLRLCKNYRGTNLRGDKVAKKKTILNIGPVSRFDDGEPDFIKRLRQSFREGMPIIDELMPYVNSDEIQSMPEIITLKFEQGRAECIGHPKLFSHVLLGHVFKALGLTQFFTAHKSRTKIEYDLVGLVKLMCFGRIINPSSKRSTFYQNDDYYEAITKTKDPYAIYRALDVLHEKRSNVLQKMNTEITKTIGRNTDLVFYDVTNFYFEIEYADEDTVVDGELVKGLRQRGVSKENKKSPIVQMGLFMDSNGIPISFETFAGNALDQTTLRPAMKKTMDHFDLSRFVLVSDRGMISGPNIAHIMKANHGYIMSKSIKKTAKTEREWILKQEEYVYKTNDFKYKSRIINRTITDEDGNKQKVKQKIVVYWSKKFYNKECREHQSFLDFIEAFKANPSNFRVSKTQQGYLKKFMKKEFMNKLTGEVIDGNELMGFIDEDKLSKNTEFYGYYQLVSSELDMSEEDIIEKYHGLNQIENQFKIMKSTLETRPMYVNNREHIQAHLTVCLIALIMMRVIQFMIRKLPTVVQDAKLTWHEGLSADRVQAALNKFQVEELAQGFYRFNNTDDEDVLLLLQCFGLNLEQKLYSDGDLRAIASKLSEIK